MMETPTSQELNWLALNLVPKLGAKTLQKLFEHFGSIDAILQQSVESLSQQTGLSRELAQRISVSRQVPAFEIERRLVAESSISIASIESDHYPKPLKQIKAFPAILYYQGSLQCLKQPCIGIVGSRACSAYGRQQTRRFVKELSEMLPNACIVSGLARGIDTVAHEAALEFGLPTVAVLAGGLHHIYPAENRGLAQSIAEQGGAVITEFPIASKPLANNFPIRNRIISGLSQGILIAEATQKSGALITGSFALEQNREVFAFPGNIDSKASAGTNHLISIHQARLVVSAQQVVEELSLMSNRAPQQAEFTFAPSKKPLQLKQFPEQQSKILSRLSQAPQSLELLSQETDLDIQQLLGTLIELEMQSFIQSTPAQQYQLHPDYEILETA